MRLLLLPGMDGTGRLFESLAAHLPADLNPTIVSYPPDVPLDYEGLFPLVEAQVDDRPFVVVGESFSGPLALMLASRRFSGLRGVVLCASFVKFPLKVPARWRKRLRPWMFRLQPLWFLSWILLGMRCFGPLGRTLRAAVRSVHPEVLACRANAVATVDVEAELRDCNVPILYLRANNDRVISRTCSDLIQSIRPDVEIVSVPGPHLLLQVSPIEASAVLSSFCERVGGIESGSTREESRR